MAVIPAVDPAETAGMRPSRTGWLTTLIERARTSGVDDRDIAAARERSIVFRPLTSPVAR